MEPIAPITNIRRWFEYWYKSSTIPTGILSERVSLSYVTVSTKNRDFTWLNMWNWLDEYGTQDIDYFLFWFDDTAHAYFKDDELALMFKLRWV
jgi:hypothetical protein